MMWRANAKQQACFGEDNLLLLEHDEGLVFRVVVVGKWLEKGELDLGLAISDEEREQTPSITQCVDECVVFVVWVLELHRSG